MAFSTEVTSRVLIGGLHWGNVWLSHAWTRGFFESSPPAWKR